ncbi:MAG: T9SS type A sorting domain-containing protein [Saprospiraceae bacterium]
MKHILERTRPSAADPNWEVAEGLVRMGSGYNCAVAYIPGTASTLVSTGKVGTMFGSSYSNDGGLNWTVFSTTSGVYAPKFLNSITGWAGGLSIGVPGNFHGGIYKFAGLTSGVHNPETGKEIFFNAYPNPAGRDLTVHIANAGNDALKISILDLHGRTVFANEYAQPGEFFLRPIDLSGLSKGLYVLKAESAHWVLSKKISLQ